jgi:hypothetical protein
MAKFIYVFTVNSRDLLLKKGYQLLQSDDTNNIFVFANTEKMAFDLHGVIHLASDTLFF